MKKAGNKLIDCPCPKKVHIPNLAYKLVIQRSMAYTIPGEMKRDKIWYIYQRNKHVL